MGFVTLCAVVFWLATLKPEVLRLIGILLPLVYAPARTWAILANHRASGQYLSIAEKLGVFVRSLWIMLPMYVIGAFAVFAGACVSVIGLIAIDVLISVDVEGIAVPALISLCFLVGLSPMALIAYFGWPRSGK